MGKLKYTVAGVIAESEVYTETTVCTQRNIVKVLLNCLSCPVENLSVTIAKIEDEKYNNMSQSELMKAIGIKENQIVEIDEVELAKDNEIVREDFYKQHMPFNRGKRYRKKRNLKMLNSIRRQLIGTHRLKVLD